MELASAAAVDHDYGHLIVWEDQPFGGDPGHDAGMVHHSMVCLLPDRDAEPIVIKVAFSIYPEGLVSRASCYLRFRRR